MGDVKRSYDSPRRRRQAEGTRRRLAASARRLFAEQGYAATTIESIALEAGLAVQTFYATYGSKRGVLLALIDEVEEEADLEGLLRRLEDSAGDPREQLRHIVEFNVGLFGGAGDVLEVLRGAGSADEDLSSVWREAEERRRVGQAPLVEAWARSGALRTGMQSQDAADVMWALTGPDAHRLFVRERGWPARRYAEWLRAALEQQLFGSPPPK